MPGYRSRRAFSSEEEDSWQTQQEDHGGNNSTMLTLRAEKYGEANAGQHL
ncbi:hypothetical protein [Streptomyces sp. B21-083]